MPEAQTLVLVESTKLDAILLEIRRINDRLDNVEMQRPKDWLLVKDYAEHIGKTTRTVGRWIAQGKIDARQEGDVVFVRANCG